VNVPDGPWRSLRWAPTQSVAYETPVHQGARHCVSGYPGRDADTSWRPAGRDARTDVEGTDDA